MLPSRSGAWIRSAIKVLKPYETARGVARTGLLLDANENPFPNKRSGILVNRYPDPVQHELRNAVANYVGLKPENVLAGNGSDEVIDWIFKVFCQPGVDRVAIAEPTYDMYTVMANILGVATQELALDQEFQFNAKAFLRTLSDDVTLLFLCSPNNPTGNLLDREEILTLASNWGKPVVVDEAYVEFSSRPSLCQEIERIPNLIVVRTFSKAFGCAGLRLGYVVAVPEIIDCFLKVKAPYNLNSFTQEQGVDVLAGLSDAAVQVDQIMEQRSVVAEVLKRIPGVDRVYPSEANFLLFRCRKASEVCCKLRACGVIVRDRSSFSGLQDCIRVTVSTADENSLFLQHLREVLSGVES